MHDKKSNQSAKNKLNGNDHDLEAMDNPPIWQTREMGAKFEDDSIDCCNEKICV